MKPAPDGSSDGLQHPCGLELHKAGIDKGWTELDWTKFDLKAQYMTLTNCTFA